MVPICAAAIVCEHDSCLPGAPLDPACDPCVTAACDVDASCCSVAWADACIAQLKQVCGIDCTGGACQRGYRDLRAAIDWVRAQESGQSVVVLGICF